MTDPVLPIDAKDAVFKILQLPADAGKTDADLMAFLENTSGLSGRAADWPQLKPAMRWAVARIRGLEAKLAATKQKAKDAVEVMGRIAVSTPEQLASLVAKMHDEIDEVAHE